MLSLRNSAKTSVHTAVETITPKMAAKYLDGNVERQRALNSTLLSRLTKSMKSGEWQLNGETIIFDQNDKLLNGQHRLNACIASNTKFTTIVVRGIANSAFESIDIGRSRRAEDLLKIQGFGNYTLLTAVVRLALTYKRSSATARRLDPNTCIPIVDHHDILHFAIDNPDFAHHCTSVESRFRNVKKFMPFSVATFVYALFSEIDEEKREQFFHCLDTGVPTADNCKVLAAREKLIDFVIKNPHQRGRVANYYKIGLLLDAWNWIVDNTYVSQFKADEPLPVIENNPWK